MRRAYKAVLHGDRVEWLDGAPEADGPLPVYIPLEMEKPIHLQRRSVLLNDHVKWLDDAPELDGPVQTYVVILDKAKPNYPENKGAIGTAMLEILADLGAFAEIEDPVAWQREQRKDRPMPFRDYDVG